MLHETNIQLILFRNSENRYEQRLNSKGLLSFLYFSGMIEKKHLLLLFCALFALNTFAGRDVDAPNPDDSTSTAIAEIDWMTMEEAMEAIKTEPKLIFIDFYTDWCGWCKRMDGTTFKDSLIVKEISENYYAVKFDAEQKEDFTIQDRTYKFVESGRRGYHELAAELMGGQMSYPTYVFLNSDLAVLTKVPGFKSQQDFHPILVFIDQFDKKQSVSYQAFLEAYESPYTEE